MKPLEIEAVDYHTAGEPFRIVTQDAVRLDGDTVLDKRDHAADHCDEIRRLLINEPRGHADMYGGFVTEPNDEGAHLGVVFFHNAGYSTACGHGTIALVTWALESGLVEATGSETEVVVDVPSGRVRTLARGGRDGVESVVFTNVPSFVETTGLQVPCGDETLNVDISYGGAFYASVDPAQVGLGVSASDLPRLIDLGRELKSKIEKMQEVVHPEESRLRGVYGVIFYERQERHEGELRQRNVTVFADGEVDRSPCGSGTSARLALLDASGELLRGDRLIHQSIVDSEFVAWVSGDAEVDGRPAVITEIEGAAFVSGYHRFVLDPRDRVGTGFLLR